MDPFLCPPTFLVDSPVSNCANFPSSTSSDHPNEEFWEKCTTFQRQDNTFRPEQQWKVELRRTSENSIPVLRFSKKFAKRQVPDQEEYQGLAERQEVENALPLLPSSGNIVNPHITDQQADKVPLDLEASDTRNTIDDDIQIQYAVRRTAFHRARKQGLKISRSRKRPKSEPVLQEKTRARFLRSN